MQPLTSDAEAGVDCCTCIQYQKRLLSTLYKRCILSLEILVSVNRVKISLLFVWLLLFCIFLKHICIYSVQMFQSQMLDFPSCVPTEEIDPSIIWIIETLGSKLSLIFILILLKLQKILTWTSVSKQLHAEIIKYKA